MVAPSHIISLWSRLGAFKSSDLDRLMWRDRKVFLHWTPIAFLVLTEDYPIFHSLMKRYPESLTKSWGNHIPRARQFLADHKALRKRMCRDLKKGPLLPTQFRDYVRAKRSEDGWSGGSDVSNMLFHMHMSGEVMVVGRERNQNIWGLSEEFLPSWAMKKELSEEEFEWEAAQRALRGLGTAVLREIHYYFPPGRYRNLNSTLTRLEDDSVIHPVNVVGLKQKGTRYIHHQDISLLESVSKDWEPRVSLLPPFDNMLRQHEKVFDFEYVREQFLPKEKRRFGTYVLPILWGDRFIGRIDPQFDKKEEKLMIKSVHAEHGAPSGSEISFMIREAVELLSDFIGAKEVVYRGQIPAIWKNVLR